MNGPVTPDDAALWRGLAFGLPLGLALWLAAFGKACLL